MSKIEEGRVILIDFSGKKKLAHGSFGSVYKVNSIFSNTPMALKLAHTEDTLKDIQINPSDKKRIVNQASRDVLNEAKTLNQLEPGSAVQFSVKNGSKSINGYLGPLFNRGDLYYWLNSRPPLEQRSDCCIQLLNEGCSLLSEIRHGDIKIENVFVDQIEGKRSFKIRDLGSSQFYEDPNFTYKVGSTTPGSFHPKDQEALGALEIKIEGLEKSIGDLLQIISKEEGKDHPSENYIRRQKQILEEKENELAEAKKDFKEAERKRDIFALGVVLFTTLTLKEPYPSVDGSIRENALLKTELFRGLPKQTTELLINMLKADPNQRPTLVQIEKALNKIQSELRMMK